MAIEIVPRRRRYRAVVLLHGKRISKSFHRRVDAEAWERQQLLAIDRGELPQTLHRAKAMTLKALRERFVQDYAQVRQGPSTQLLEGQLFRKWIEPFLGTRPIQKLRRADFEAYFLELLNARKVTPKRINRIRTLLHGMFNRAVSWELIPMNPIAEIEPFDTDENSSGKEVAYLSQPETARLLTWLADNDPWLYPKVEVLVSTGLRYGEMVALRVRDLVPSPTGANLQISRTFCRHTYQIRNRTKGGKSRVVPLRRDTAERLKGLITGKAPEAPLLYKNWEEGRHSTRFRKHLETALKAAQVPRIRIHDLRHTFAAHYLERGGHLYDLQKLLGHSSSRLTERYSHFSGMMLERARGVLDPGTEVKPVTHKFPTKRVSRPQIPRREPSPIDVKHLN